MLLKELAMKYENAQIITHTDLDGYGAGAILVKILMNLGFSIENIMVTHADYTNAFPVNEEYNLVFLSDISISNREDASKLVSYASKPNNLVFWFDHHKTSIDMYEFYPDLKDIPGIRDTNACGTMLCWIFYQIMNYHAYTEGVIEELNNVNVREIMISSAPGIYKNVRCSSNPSATPIGIILTDDYDRFVLADTRSKFYMEAFNSYPNFKKDCKSSYFQDMYMYPNDALCEKFVSAGEEIFLWKRILALNALKEYGFIASLPIEGMKNIEMICINSTNKGSMMFGRCLGNNDGPYMQYNYACVYSNNGEKTTVSIYCPNPDTTPKEQRKIGQIYNASDICKRFGGGGHPGAAGFVTDKVNFCNIKKLPKKFRSQIDDEIKELMDEVAKL